MTATVKHLSDDRSVVCAADTCVRTAIPQHFHRGGIAQHQKQLHMYWVAKFWVSITLFRQEVGPGWAVLTISTPQAMDLFYISHTGGELPPNIMPLGKTLCEVPVPAWKRPNG